MHLPWNSPNLLDPAAALVAGQVFGKHNPYQPATTAQVLSDGNLQPPVTVANTATETTVYQISLPDNFFFQGCDLRIAGMGFHSAAASPTIRIRVYKGTTILLDTGANNSGNSTNSLVELRAHITGQSGTSVWSQGYYNELGGGINSFPMINTAATTISASAEILKVTTQWGTASASNTITWTNMSAYFAPPAR